MSGSITNIPPSHFFILLLPLLPVFAMLYYWQMGLVKSFYALARMLIQLVAIGYVLTFIFAAQKSYLVLLVLGIMMLAATWISLNPLKNPDKKLYLLAFVSVFVAGSITLFTVTIGVLHTEPWYAPRLIIPLAGMIYVVSMNAISLSAERILAELEQGMDFETARKAAANAALIPAINSLFAVGLVSLPGMMTGQILSGVDPLITVKYQIVVMIMSFTATGLTTLLFLYLTASHFRHFEKAAIQNN